MRRRDPRTFLTLTVLLLAGCTTAAPGGGKAAPWRTEASVAAPPVLLAEWRAAENREQCAPMTLEGGGVGAREGTPRRANFAGGWGVAWDVPNLPGRDASGRPCAECGRGVYGIAGAGVVWDGIAASAPFPHRLEWSGGEAAYYGPEGGTGPNWLAQLRVSGQPCVYHVWSFLGRGHLEELLASVRRVRQ